MRRFLLLLALLIPASAPLAAQEVSLEYRVKAAYLFNFLRFVEWPDTAPAGPLTICVAGRNPFGPVLAQTVGGESVDGRMLATRVILSYEPGCHVIFIPAGAATTAYLRGALGTPTLTVGESPNFIRLGGIINFVIEDGHVRFQINPQMAERAQLRISSRLLQLARIVTDEGGDE